MAPKTLGFSAGVDKWVQKTKQRMEAVFKTASQAVSDDVIDRTPVDTGFLRASWTISLDGMKPIKRGNRGEKDRTYDAPDVALRINSAKLGSTIYASFTAEYAGVVEYGDGENRKPVGMVRLAAQNWPKHVRAAVKAAKAAVRQQR